MEKDVETQERRRYRQPPRRRRKLEKANLPDTHTPEPENKSPEYLPRLRDVRLERNLTQRELVKLAGVSLPTISHGEWCDRKIRYGTALKLAEALQTTISNLRGEDAGEG